VDKLKALAKSRKFWAAVLGVGVVVLKGLRPDFPMSDEQLLGMVALLSSYIVGTGLDQARPTS
jgi:hypothetical protein